MNAKSREARKLVDHLLEGEDTYADVDELRDLLARHGSTLDPGLLERIASLSTATDHGWNFATGEEHSDPVDCAPVAELARAELSRRKAEGPGLRQQERHRARRRAEFAGIARRPKAARFDELVAALADADLDVRVHAARALGKLGSLEAVDALVRSLRKPDAELREAAAVALGRLGGPRACAALRRALRDEVDTVCAAAADSLGALRDASAVVALLRLVGHTFTEYAEPHALKALKKIGAKAVPAVRRAVKTQRYERAFLIPLLAELDPRGARSILEPLLEAEDAGTRDAAAKALKRIGRTGEKRARRR